MCPLEQSTRHLVSVGAVAVGAFDVARVASGRCLAFFRVWRFRQAFKPVAPREATGKASRACTRSRGDESLGVSNKAGSANGADREVAQNQAPDEKKGRKQRTGDLGRALRTIYDETLRESVPDDFTNLLGKLS